MASKVLLTAILMVVTMLMVGSTVSLPADPDPAKPPMYTVHDFASEELQKRRNIPDDKPCDTAFGTELEGIVNEMEENKDGNQELATRLRNQFTEVMEKNKEKMLCGVQAWCDMGLCKKRGVKVQGRSMGGGPRAAAAAAADQASSTIPPAPPTDVNTTAPVDQSTTASSPPPPSKAGSLLAPSLFGMMLSAAAVVAILQ